jgi:hypothetical protein
MVSLPSTLEDLSLNLIPINLFTELDSTIGARRAELVFGAASAIIAYYPYGLRVTSALFGAAKGSSL